MRRKLLSLLVALLLLSSLASPPVLSWKASSEPGKSDKSLVNPPPLPRPQDSSTVPDIDVGTFDYRYINSTHMMVYANLTNNGVDSGPFNVTFALIRPVPLRAFTMTNLSWINVSGEIENATVVHSGEVVHNGSAVIRQDDGYLVYVLPFTLNYFGRNITGISVSTNGNVELLEKWENPKIGSRYGVHYNGYYKTSDVLFPLDDDLETSDGYLAVVGFKDKVVVEWFGSTYRDYDSSDYPINFQVVIFSNGTILFSYRVLRYSGYSYDLFSGYYSKVSMGEIGINATENSTFVLNLPKVEPSLTKVAVNSLPSGKWAEPYVVLPIQNLYAEVRVDWEEKLNETYRANNLKALSIWPGNYRVENVSMGEVVVGKEVEINATITTTSLHPERVQVALLRNGSVELVDWLFPGDFINGTASWNGRWLVQGGSYNLSFVISTGHDLNITDNSRFLGHFTLPKPNFAVSNLSISVPPCINGELVVNATVINNGGANWSGGFWVVFLVSYNTTRDRVSEYVSSLPSGGEVTLSVPFRLRPGKIEWIAVVVDPDGFVDESDENDNVYNETYDLNVGYPDFIVTNVSIPSNMTSGNSYLVNVSYANVGTCYSGDVYLTLYEDGSIEDSVSVPGNGSGTVGMTLVPSSPGWKNVTAIINPDSRIPESNYSNNEVTKRVLILGPDLVIENVTLLSFPGTAGSAAVFNVTIRNIGKAFTRSFYVGTAGALGNDFEYLSGGLGENESTWVILRPILNGGDYNLTFKVDFYDYVKESNEGNNEYEYHLSVPLPDFVIKKVDMPNNTVGDVTFRVNITNTGAAFNVTYYPVPITLRVSGRTYTGYIRSSSVGELFENGESVVIPFHTVVYPPGGTVNVTVDPYDRVTEVSANNSAVFEYKTGYPDFVPEIILPQEMKAGERVEVTVVVFNRGNTTFNGTYSTPGIPVYINHTTEVGGVNYYSTYSGLIPPGGNITRTTFFDVQGGLNVITVTLDYLNRWEEPNESNNVASVNFTLEKPDFTITGLSVPGEVLNGSAYLWRGYGIAVNVTNLGGDFGGVLTLYLYEDDHYESSASIAGLSGGETKTVTLYYYPDPGSHNVTVVIDKSNGWAESNEDNNEEAFQTSFGRPELEVLGVTWEPYNFTSGENVKFIVSIRNAGQPFERSFWTKVEIWNGSSRMTYGWAYPPNWYFDPNATKNLTWTWYNAKPGNLTLKIVADYYDSIPELNESNNNFTANIGSVGTPDFHIKGLEFEEPAYGKRIRVVANLTNLGESIYRPFTVLLNVSGSFYGKTVYGIEANETKVLSWDITLYKIGNVTFKVVADPWNSIAESNESNNEASGSAYVEAPDLTISSYRFIEKDLASGYVTFKLNVTNLGGDDYAGFYVGGYVDNETNPRATAFIGSIMKGETKEVLLRWEVKSTGEHNVSLRADLYGAVPESNETNNEVKTSYYIEEPDLSVEGVAVEGDLIAGNIVTFHVTLKNLGGAYSGSVNVLVYADDQLFKNYTMNLLLGKNASKIIHVSGVRLLSGEHNYTVKIRTEIEEKSLLNNERVILLSTPVPDLTIEILNGADEIGVGKNEIDLRFVSHNAPARNVLIKLMVKQGNETKEYTVAYSYWKAGWDLEEGEVYEKSVDIDLKPGDYEITAIIDPDDIIGETDETNNRNSLSGFLEVPDLEITGLRILGESYIGAKMYLLFNITNHGGLVRDVPIKYEVLRNGKVLSIAEHTSGTITVIEANSWREYDFDNTNLYAGNLTIRAWIDPENIIPESNESNNYFETNLTIEPVDLQVVEIELPEINGYGWYIGNITVKNNGPNAVSSPYRLRISARIVMEAEGKNLTVSTGWVDQIMPGQEVKIPFRFKVDSPQIKGVKVQLIPILCLGSFCIPFPPSFMDNFDFKPENNALSRELNMTVPAPDLVIVNYTYWPSNPTERDPLKFNVTVRNAGDGPSLKSEMGLTFGGREAYLGYGAVIPPLQPGETYTLHFTATRDQYSTYGLYNGNLSLRIKSDFIEKNESNNVVNFHVPIKLIPILTVDTRLIRLDRKLVISRPSTITVPIRNHGHVGANVTITSEFATFPEFSIGPTSSKYVKGTVLVPENRTDLVGSRIPIVMNLSAPYNNFTFTYSTNIYSGAEPEDLVPKDKDIVNRVLIYWRTELPSNGTLYYREVGDENWTKINMGEGYVHTALLPLDYKKWYEYYVVSWNRFGNHTSEVRRFYTFRSLGFEKAEYHFTVRRDYNQFRTINVLNPLNESRKAEAIIESTYPDIAVGFVGSKSWTAKEVFPAHSNVTLSLGIHLQDARQWNYTLLASLQDEEGIKDYAIIRVDVEPVIFNVTYRILNENPYTLTKTIELINNGGNVTDFYLLHSDEVVLSPELLHFNFRAGQRVIINVTPVLTGNFTSLTETLVMTGANQRANFTLEFRVPAGKKVFRITPNLTIEFFYPDDSVFTNPEGTVPSYLFNGTPYFFGRVYVRVRAYGYPLPSMNVTLTLRNSTSEVSDWAVTDVLGTATFNIVARGGEEYSYIVTLGENVTTGWKSFYVNATPIKSVMPGAVNLSVIDALGDNGTVLIDPPYIFIATFPNLSRLYTNDTLAVLRIRRYSFPASEWVSVGTFNGERFTFNVTNLAMGLYEARVFIENGLFYATSKPFVFLAAPSNFTPVPRRALYAFGQDINGSVIVLSTDVNSTSADKMVFVYSVTPYNSTHSNLTLLVYTDENITDVLNLTMFDGNNRTIYHISRTYNFTAPLTVVTFIVPSNATGYLLTLEDPFSMRGMWRAVKRTGGRVVRGAKNLVVEGGRTLYLMAKDGILTPHTKSGVIVLCAAEMIPVFGTGLALAELGSDALSAILSRNAGAMGVVGLKKGTGDIKDYAEGIVKDSAQGYDELLDYAKRIAASRGNPERIEAIMREIERLQITDPEKFQRLRKALAYYNDLMPSAKVVKTTREATEVVLEPGVLGARDLMKMGNREFTSYLKWFVMREAKNVPKTLLDEAKATKLTRLAKIAKGGTKLIPLISVGATLYSNYENWRRVVKEGGGWFTPAVTFNIQATASSRTSGSLWCLNQKDISGVVEPAFDNPTVGYLIRKNLDRNTVRRAIKKAVVLLEVQEDRNAPLHDLYLLLNGREIFSLENVPAINREFMIPVDPSLIFPVSENELTVLAPLYNPGVYSLATGMELEYLVDLSKLPLPLDDLVSMYLVGANFSDVMDYLSILESKIYTSDGAIMHVIRSDEKGTQWSPLFFLVELGNKGNAEAWTGVVVLYVNGSEVDAVPVGRLGPLESDYALLVWVPNETGRYSIEIRYDYLYGSPIEDRDYSNNVYRTRVDVLPAVPDLTVWNVTYEGIPNNVTIRGIVDNLGGLNVEETELAVYVNGTLEWLSNVSLGPFNVSLALDAGVYNITLAVDPRNIVNESNETNNVYSFTAEVREPDTTPPTIVINSPSSGVYNVSRIDVNVTITDESELSRVYVEVGNTSIDLVRVPETDFWIGTALLPDGNTTLTVEAVDTFGNAANASVWVLVDTKAPRISILGPLNGTYNDGNVTFNYTVEEENLKFVRTYLDGEETPIASGESVELGYGTHEFRVVAGDIAGHLAEKSVIFRINEPPTVDFTWNATYLMVHFTANASDPDGISRYLWDFGDGETSEEQNPLHIYTEGGIYNVTLTVWDAYNLSASVTKAVEVFANVSLTKNETHTFRRDFGFYNTTLWEPFKRDFENWTLDVLSSIPINTSEFDEVYEILATNWSLVAITENLSGRAALGWINATYERRVVVRGRMNHNETLMLLIQRALLFANATHVPDLSGPVIRILYPSNSTYDTSVTSVRAEIRDESGVKWVKAILDGREYNMSFNGTWKASVEVGDGHHVLTIIASDIWDNVGNATVEFTVNTSVRIIHLGNVTVVIVPGEGESNVSLVNGTVKVEIRLGGEGVAFRVPAEDRIIVREGPYDSPWLVVESGARISEIETFNRTIRRNGRLYIREYVRMLVDVRKGYGVVALPIGDSRVVSVNVTKNGTTTALGTDPTKENYYTTAGGYLYVVLRGDPEVTVVLEYSSRKVERLTSRTLRTLGFLWERYYLRERDEFERKLREMENATNATTVEKALKLHAKAKEYYMIAREYFFQNDWLRYAIYARKAYITEKRALQLLSNEGEE
ncbi:CARDB domain-containing protein [Thermococcus sp.]